MNALTSRAAPFAPSGLCEVEKLVLLPSHSKSISMPTRVAGGWGGLGECWGGGRARMRQRTKEKRSGRKSITYEYVFWRMCSPALR